MEGIRDFFVIALLVFIAFGVVSTLGAALVPLIGIVGTVIVIRLAVAILRGW